MLMREGDWHAVWISWLDGGTQWGWYVNLQRPFRRTPLGFETMDLMLDVVIDLDRTWRWKDEDELALFVERAVFSTELAARVREEGREVARQAERGAAPFDGSWADWRPDPRWPRPTLPAGWERVCR
jgi:predicted RNA-binding protein associated with RNAse of E/G family